MSVFQGHGFTCTLSSFRPNIDTRCRACMHVLAQDVQRQRHRPIEVRKTLSIIIAPAPIMRSPVPTTNPDFRVSRDRYRATLSSFFPFPSFTDYGWKWERTECLEICKNDRGLEEISFALKIRILCFMIKFFFYLLLFSIYVYNYG